MIRAAKSPAASSIIAAAWPVAVVSLIIVATSSNCYNCWGAIYNCGRAQNRRPVIGHQVATISPLSS